MRRPRSASRSLPSPMRSPHTHGTDAFWRARKSCARFGATRRASRSTCVGSNTNYGFRWDCRKTGEQKKKRTRGCACPFFIARIRCDTRLAICHWLCAPRDNRHVHAMTVIRFLLIKNFETGKGGGDSGEVKMMRGIKIGAIFGVGLSIGFKKYDAAAREPFPKMYVRVEKARAENRVKTVPRERQRGRVTQNARE